MWLRNGVVAADAPIREALSAYRQHIESAAEVAALGGGDIGASVSVSGSGNSGPASGDSLQIDLKISSEKIREAMLYLGVSEGSAAPIFSVQQEVRLQPGTNTRRCTLQSLPLPRGRYFVWFALTDASGEDLIPWHPGREFDVRGPELAPLLPGVMRLSPVHVEAEWEAGDVAVPVAPYPGER